MSNLKDSLNLYVQQTELPPSTLAPLIEFFSEKPDERHLLFKRGVLYFFENEEIIDTFVSGQEPSSNDCFTFDGKKIARTSPAHYLGHNFSSQSSGNGVSFDIDISNNNNNNNNNNGNNNG